MGETFQHEDPYRILGLDHGATAAEITRAYRLQARSWHPDARPDDPDAAARFRAVTRAYEVLSDPVQRERYEREAAPAPRPHPRSGPHQHAHPPGDPPLRAGPVWVEAEPGSVQPGAPPLSYILVRFPGRGLFYASYGDYGSVLDDDWWIWLRAAAGPMTVIAACSASPWRLS